LAAELFLAFLPFYPILNSQIEVLQKSVNMRMEVQTSISPQEERVCSRNGCSLEAIVGTCENISRTVILEQDGALFKQTLLDILLWVGLKWCSIRFKSTHFLCPFVNT